MLAISSYICFPFSNEMKTNKKTETKQDQKKKKKKKTLIVEHLYLVIELWIYENLKFSKKNKPEADMVSFHHGFIYSFY